MLTLIWPGGWKRVEEKSDVDGNEPCQYRFRNRSVQKWPGAPTGDYETVRDGQEKKKVATHVPPCWGRRRVGGLESGGECFRGDRIRTATQRKKDLGQQKKNKCEN